MASAYPSGVIVRSFPVPRGRGPEPVGDCLVACTGVCGFNCDNSALKFALMSIPRGRQGHLREIDVPLSQRDGKYSFPNDAGVVGSDGELLPDVAAFAEIDYGWTLLSK